MRINREIPTGLPLAIFFSAALFFFASCSNANNANSAANSNSAAANAANAKASQAVRDDFAGLDLLINFPEQPEEVVWREDAVDQKGKRLTAVLKYGDESLSRVVASAEKHKPAAAAELGVEDWFPEELTAQSHLSGNETLKGSVYAADDFFNAPYTRGRLVRIQGTNYCVLELTTF